MSSLTAVSRQWRWTDASPGDTAGGRSGNLSRIQRLRRFLRRTIRRRRSRQEPARYGAVSR
jgi:hypothetical protein